MPRSNRPRRGGRRARPSVGEPRQLENTLRGVPRYEERAGSEWIVTLVTGSSERTYRCPGCDQEIRPGTRHVVVWRADSWRGDDAAVGERRHWHTPCWRRGQRPTRGAH